MRPDVSTLKHLNLFNVFATIAEGLLHAFGTPGRGLRGLRDTGVSSQGAEDADFLIVCGEFEHGPPGPARSVPDEFHRVDRAIHAQLRLGNRRKFPAVGPASGPSPRLDERRRFQR
jgi:hypothetical protein